ncbi:MAG: hypothetical protein COA62_15725 [Rhodobiaceae bacterium]|nr:MAG: hypothetical protein COA62_15725 [Rhodobiaceae bacterium]
MTPERAKVIEETISKVEEALVAGSAPRGLKGGRSGKEPTAVSVVAKSLGVSVRTINARLFDGESEGLKVDWSKGPECVDEMDAADYIAGAIEVERLTIDYEDRIRTLKAQISSMHRDDITREVVRRHILEVKDIDPTPPSWLTTEPKEFKTEGVPTLFASDWHWGEVVYASQVGGVNEFNLEIAHRRARRLIEEATTFLIHGLSKPNYPGIVFVLGGDMISGNIHEELATTNDLEIMPTLIDLMGVLVWCIERLADDFGFVFVPCVSGNHGRSTKKIQAKNRNATSYEWLIYQMLNKHFERDPRVAFHIPDSADASYSIYGTRHLLTHGDQFRGGGGIAGPIVPIKRGLQKKQSRNVATIGGFDLAIMGHWHQYQQTPGLLINGSLKGYDEYAYAGSFDFQKPIQSLYLTHPIEGPYLHRPIYCDPPYHARADNDLVPVSIPA